MLLLLLLSSDLATTCGTVSPGNEQRSKSLLLPSPFSFLTAVAGAAGLPAAEGPAIAPAVLIPASRTLQYHPADCFPCSAPSVVKHQLALPAELLLHTPQLDYNCRCLATCRTTCCQLKHSSKMD
ncbi:hypothetical protein COO60DRAFT_1482013 [Scenedesmus sp. NREL 46B-D3]|nr:hypothetical protein COO60DRAFT_1482013 [Scenedesmus sp. NREL 46B-D3]